MKWNDPDLKRVRKEGGMYFAILPGGEEPIDIPLSEDARWELDRLVTVTRKSRNRMQDPSLHETPNPRPKTGIRSRAESDRRLAARRKRVFGE